MPANVDRALKNFAALAVEQVERTMILGGDIGGTKTLLAYFEPRADRPVLVQKASYPSRDAASLDELVEAFITEYPGAITGACFGIAGPIQDGRSETPNLPWVIESSKLAALLGVSRVDLINDLEATAYGIAALRGDEFVDLNPDAKAAAGNAAVIAAGTGLGIAFLYWDGAQHRPFATEAGHGDFAPRNDLEMDLLRYLIKEFGHVSYERVLSGPGLYRIYQFLRQRESDAEPGWLTEELQRRDPSAVISETAQAQKNALCEEALRMFVSFYGAEAGNLALRVMAVGGIYVGGGIAPKMLDALRDGAFMRAFIDKGRFADLLRSIPVRVVLNNETALLGAARRGSL